jgi:hypothetical protein
LPAAPPLLPDDDAVDSVSLCSPELDSEGLPWLGLPEELLDELLDELEELLDELLEEGLPLELGGGVGGVELGVLGGCGVVGLLALGQPASNRQTLQMPVSCANSMLFLGVDFICPDQFVRPHWLSRLEAGTE